jgi:hypothetical protein
MTTLEEVETSVLRSSLLALADLRRKYSNEPMTTAYAANGGESATAQERCPLCCFAHTHGDEFGDDEEGDCVCPWFWIEGHTCEEYTEDGNGDMISYDTFPVPIRLQRVTRWETAINEELARRISTGVKPCACP